MENILTLVMPVYGLKHSLLNEFLRRNLQAIKDNRTEIILVYKSNPENAELNYDYLEKDFGSEKNISFHKVPFEAKKTFKTIVGVKNTKTKYVQVIDPHHTVNEKGLKNFIKLLEKKDYDLIASNSKMHNLDKEKVKLVWGTKYTLLAGVHTFKTEKILESLKLVDYDIIYWDDGTFPLYFLLHQSENGFTFRRYYKSWYERNYSTKISSTTVTDENKIRIRNDIFTILNSVNSLNLNKRKIWKKKKFRKRIEFRKKRFVNLGGEFKEIEKLSNLV